MAETEPTADIVALHVPRPLTPAERARAYRQRKRAKKKTRTTVTSAPAPAVTRDVTRPVTALPRGASVTLTLAAFALAGVGVTINAWYAHSLGSSDVAGKLFTALGVAADVAALV